MANEIALSKEVIKRGRKDYLWFGSHVLDLKEEYIWEGMRKMSNSLRDHEKTAVFAGHGVSKTFTLGRLALAFLFCHPPATVVTTAPTGFQVKDLLWREIREAYANAKMPLGGRITTTMLDLQAETGIKWFATGFSTRADTVTKEATAFQGYHNHNLLILFDEAAGILPEIWRAAMHIGAPYKRWMAVGNPTSGAGDFPECQRSPQWNHLNISVLDTPNYINGKHTIPGVYGRDYVEDIKGKYGEDSDEYRVRVLGLISKKCAKGSYHGETIEWLEANDRVGDIPFNPNYLVYTMTDPGYTSAWWAFQVLPTGFVHFLRYYEDIGKDMAFYADMLKDWHDNRGYRYGDHFAPIDIDNNQYKIVASEGLKEIARRAGIVFTEIPFERSTELGRHRTNMFLKSCRFDKEGCRIGLEKAKAFHEEINKGMSTEDKPVFTGIPAKDGNDHAADGLRGVSMIISQIDTMNPEATKQSWRATKERMTG